MSNKFSWLILIFLVAGSFTYAANQSDNQEIVLVKNNQSDFCIVVSKMASQTTKFAATELQTYIAKTTNVTLPIINDVNSGKKCLFVGANEALPKEERFLPSAYKDEAYAFLEWQNNIVIMGGEIKSDQTYLMRDKYDNLGLLYGIYDFIEQFLGTRWYAPGELGECVEQKSDIIITGLPITHKPPYVARYMWPLLSEEASSQEFDTWFRRLKGYGSIELAPNHSMEAFSQEHLDTPEIFALDANGKRIFGTCEVKTDGEKREYLWSQYPQFCYSSPKLVELYVKAIDGWYSNGPEKIRDTLLSFE